MTEQKHDDAGGASRSDAELAACPCGRTPTAALQIADAGQGSKWATVAGDCCGEWMIEFRTNYAALDSNECKRLAREAWNSAPRAANAKLRCTMNTTEQTKPLIGQSRTSAELCCERLCMDFCNKYEEAQAEIMRLRRVATRAHDMLLRGADDDVLLEMLASAWQVPSAKVSGASDD